MEALVTEKIEEELREIEEIEEIRSTSRTGISVISVELSQFIADSEIEQAWSEVRDALADAAVNLPPGVPEPDFDNDRTSAYTAISAVVARDGRDVPATVLGRYGELLQDRLRGVGGTQTVRLVGAPEEEVLVEVDPLRLVSIGLTVDAVAAAIARADAKVEAGRVRGSADDYLIEVTGEIDSLDRIRAVVLSRGGDGPLVRVADVGTVRRAVRTPVETKAFADGSRAVVVAARMEPDLQVDAWMGRVRETLRDFEEDLPAGLEHRLLFDQSTYTADRLGTLAQNLAIGVGLVVAVLFVTLGWRAALVVALMLPLTSLLSLAVLQRLGVPIHQMSVTGLIVALGLLVDAAIVMTDEIRRRIAAGMARADALAASSKRLATPLAASTATTVFAFMPMAVLPGPAGDFVGAIATAVIVMLVVSLLLALTVTPAMAGFLLPRGDARPAWWRNGARSGLLGRVFGGSLDLALRHRGLGILAALVLPLIGFAAFPTLTAQFFPGVERDQFHIQMKLPDGASLAETEAAVQAADAILRAEGDIRNVHWFLGESAPAFYYNMTADQDGVPSFAEALVTTRTEEAAEAMVPRLQTALDLGLPQAQVIVRDLVQGPPVAAPVEIRIVGPDLETLRALGEDVRRMMAATPEVTHTRATLLGGAPKLVFDLDEDRVRLAGLSLAEIARQLQTLTEGATGGSLIEGSEELPVRIRVPDSGRIGADTVSGFHVLPLGATVTGSEWPGIPLSAPGRGAAGAVRQSDRPAQRRAHQPGAGLSAARRVAGGGAEAGPGPAGRHAAGAAARLSHRVWRRRRRPGRDGAQPGRVPGADRGADGRLHRADFQFLPAVAGHRRGVAAVDGAQHPGAGGVRLSVRHPGADRGDRLHRRVDQRRHHHHDRPAAEPRRGRRRPARDPRRGDGVQPAHRLDHPDHLRRIPAADPGRRRFLAALRHGDRRRRAAVHRGVVLLRAADVQPGGGAARRDRAGHRRRLPDRRAPGGGRIAEPAARIPQPIII